MRGLNIALVLVVVCSCPVGISHAQSCVDPANLCDQWWDTRTSTWIQNPTCKYLNHTLAPPGNASVAAALRKAVLASPLPKSESALLHALSKASGIYVKARLTYSHDGAKQTASYEYLERADRYRIRLGPGLPWLDVAFDGKFYQQGGDDMVEIRRGDDRSTPMPDGPLALALASLRVNDATECWLCQLRLADLKKAMQWRSEGVAKLAAVEAVIGTGKFDAGVLRTSESDAEGRLVGVVWLPDAANSNQGFEVRLGEYQPLGGTDAVFPMRLTARLAPQTSVEYVVEKIELSPTFGEEVFDLHSTARKVLYGVIDRNGSWHGNFVRYQPTPGPPCGETHKQ
jgi:hypothetical protein